MFQVSAVTVYKVGSSVIYTDTFQKQYVALIICVDHEENGQGRMETIYTLRLPNRRELQARGSRLKPLYQDHVAICSCTKQD